MSPQVTCFPEHLLSFSSSSDHIEAGRLQRFKVTCDDTLICSHRELSNFQNKTKDHVRRKVKGQSDCMEFPYENSYSRNQKYKVLTIKPIRTTNAMWVKFSNRL